MKTDVYILRGLFRFGKLLGITCSWLESDNNSSISFSRLYIILLSIVAFVGTVLSILDRYYGFWRFDGTVTQMILESLEMLSELSLLLTCYWTSISKNSRWKELFTEILKADKILSIYKLQVNANICRYVLRIGLYHLLYVLLHVYELSVWLNRGVYTTEYGYIQSRIAMYYQLYTTLLVVFIAKCLKKRYEFINKVLIELIEGKRKTVIISQESNQYFTENLYQIKAVFAILSRVIFHFNVLFGWSIFFSAVSNILVCLININYIIEFADNENDQFETGLLITSILYTVVYSISTIAILMSCDGVQRSGESIQTTCYLYQNQVERTAARNELVVFANFAGHLSPNFSAAGFFQINQSTLSTLFSALVTYLIVIIQFDMSRCETRKGNCSDTS